MNYAYRFFETWLANNNLKLTTVGTFEPHFLGGKFELLAMEVMCEYKTWRRGLPKDEQKFWPQPRVHDFQFAIARYRHRKFPEILAERHSSIAFTGFEDLSNLAKFVRALVGEDSDLFLYTFAHHISNIKRRLKGLPIQWHLMPIVSGAQGTGKTVAIKRLYSPLGDLFTEMSLTDVVDKFNRHIVERHACILFDELSGLDRVDSATLKRLISADTSTARGAYERESAVFKHLASFIGTTNLGVPFVIKDTTGARRFVEIRVNKQTDWKAIGTEDLPGHIDFAKLWQGISEEKNAYWARLFPLLSKHQETLSLQDAVTEFCNEFSLKPANDAEVTPITSPTFYRLFKEWCNETGSMELSANYFGRALTQAGIKREIYYHNSRRHTLYLVSVNHGLPKDEITSEKLILERYRNLLAKRSEGNAA